MYLNNVINLNMSKCINSESQLLEMRIIFQQKIFLVRILWFLCTINERRAELQDGTSTRVVSFFVSMYITLHN